MARYYIDCREYPSEIHCSLAMSADSKEELLEAAVQHAVQVHGHADTPAVRAEIEQALKQEAPRS